MVLCPQGSDDGHTGWPPLGSERPLSLYAAHSPHYKTSRACPGMPTASDIARMARGRGQTASPWGAQVPQTLAATTAERPMLLAS